MSILEQTTTAVDRVNLLNEISYNMRRQAPEEVLSFSRQALRLAKEVEYTKGEAIALKNIGIAFSKLERSSDSIYYYFQSALTVASKVDDFVTQAACHNNIGLTRLNYSEYGHAISNFHTAFSIIKAKKLNLPFLRGLVLGNLGVAYAGLAAIGQDEYKFEYYQKAEEYLKSSTILARNHKLPALEALVLDDLARVQLELGRPILAIHTLKKAIDIQEQIGDDESKPSSLIVQSRIYIQSGDYQKAFDFAQQAYTLSKEREKSHEESDALLCLAEIAFRKQNYKSSISYAQVAIDMTKQAKRKDNEILAYQLIARSYKETGYWKKAYNAIAKYQALLEAQQNMHFQTFVDQLDLEQKYSNSSAELMHLEGRSKAQESKVYLLLFMAICLVSLTFVVFLLYKNQRASSNLFRTKNSELEKRNQALVQAENRYKNLLKTSPSALIQFDLEGNIVFASDQVAKLSGDLPEVLTGNKFEILHPETSEPILPEIISKLERDGSIQSLEGLFIGKDDSKHFIEGNICYTLDQEHEPNGLMLVFNDNTDKKDQEKLIQDQIIQLNKTNTELNKYITSSMQLENFAYIASHDMKTPLRSIIAFAQLLQLKVHKKLDSEENEYLNNIIESTQEIISLTTDLLSYTRIGRKENFQEHVDLRHMVDEVINEFTASIRDFNVKIEKDFHIDHFIGDKEQVSIVLNNLISNAIKFRKPEKNPNILIKVAETAKDYEFTVKDDGIGIEKKYRDRIFLIFKRLHTKKEYKGTGIGLAICKKIVEGFGGKIRIESSLGKGSSFIFTLPKPRRAISIVQPVKKPTILKGKIA